MMPPQGQESYKLVNYFLRPAKAVARKMLCETFRRLSHFAPLESYRYVGFGSVFYADFLVLHRALGLKKMVNIEGRAEAAVRFRFNRPYSFIECRFEPSTVALPKLSWRPRSIVWLDYDGTLDEGALADIQTVCSSARSGSMFVVSFRAEHTDFGTGPNMWPAVLTGLRARFGERLPPEVLHQGQRIEVTKEGLATTRGAYARVLAKIALDEMEVACRVRSAEAGADRRVRFEQLLDLEYNDSTRMVTVGGVIFEAKDAGGIRRCAFDRGLPFVVRRGQPHHEVVVPKLTHRETRYLEQRLPTKSSACRKMGIPLEMAQQYERIYRWFPHYVETEVLA